MFPTATIVFREILEIALVLGIVMAATKGLHRRGALAALGLSIGIAGSIAIAFFTDTISSAIEGVGQEVFNASIMLIAACFIGWTVIWMKRHGRNLAKNLNEVGKDIAEGRKSFYVLVSVIALATFREGAEIVLFTYSMGASGAISLSSIIMGGIIGTIGGVIVGMMLYFGLLKAVKRHLFTVTSWMLIILTAGMASHGAGLLIAANILPEISTQLWDSSWFISGHGFLGKTLSVLIGYTPRPSGMEVVVYVGVLITMGALYNIVGRPAKIQEASQA